MPLVKLSLNDISIDTALQCREHQDVDTIAEYAQAYKSGAKIPPIIVFNDGKLRWVADGFHRHPAAKQAGLKQITVDERKGTKRDALLFAVGANAEHGLRRTNADKRRAVDVLLKDAEWSKWPAREIARRCQVTHPFVLAVQKESVVTVTSETSPEVVTVTTPAQGAPSKKGGGSPANAKSREAEIAPVPATPAAETSEDDPFASPDPLKLAIDAHAAATDISTRILAVIRDWESIGQDVHPFISQQAVSAFLKNAVADIRLGQPYAACPYCKGAKCAACKETGWVTKSVYANAPTL
jgi:hypothetical protein